MKRMLVIGIGSMIMKDDGIGTRVAGAIEGRLREQSIEVLIGETDVQYCIGEIRSGDFLVIIDAAASGREPGSIDIIPLKEVIKSYGRLYSQHDFSLINAISMSYPETEGFIIGIQAAEIGFGFELSGVLSKSFESICDNVLKEIINIKEAASIA